MPDPEYAHVMACIRRHGARGAVNKCNRCKFVKHKADWQSRLPWLAEQPLRHEPWGLGCSVCSAAQGSVPSCWTVFSKGQRGVLQIEDLRRHGESEAHLANSGLRREPVPDVCPKPRSKHAVPTAAQVRLALEVARSPLVGQGAEFERRSELASRTDRANFPDQFNHRSAHSKLIRCLALALPLG